MARNVQRKSKVEKSILMMQIFSTYFDAQLRFTEDITRTVTQFSAELTEFVFFKISRQLLQIYLLEQLKLLKGED